MTHNDFILAYGPEIFWFQTWTAKISQIYSNFKTLNLRERLILIFSEIIVLRAIGL